MTDQKQPAIYQIAKLPGWVHDRGQDGSMTLEIDNQRHEPVLIQALLPKSSFERLDKRVVRGFPTVASAYDAQAWSFVS